MKRLCQFALVSVLALGAAAPSYAQDSEPAGSSRAKSKPARKAAAKPAAKPAAASVPGGGQAVLVATFNDWSAYTAQTGKSKICYALSQPKSRSAANLKATPAYIFVSFRPAENVKNEVAAVLGFAAKDGGDAELTVGRSKYALVTKGQNAWVKNPSEEAQTVATMAKGEGLSVTTTSARGNKVGDRYSLSGFAQALDRARKDCS